MSEEEIAAQAAALGKYYLEIGKDVSNQGRPPQRWRLGYSLALIAAAISFTFISPYRPPDMPNLCPIAIAISIASGFGKVTGWGAVSVAVLWLAWVVPPADSLLVDAQYLSWIFELVLAWASIAGVATSYDGPERRRRRRKSSIRDRVRSSSEIG